ncbi:MAG: bifunctional ornithine acetyltransferase/N-acetylglutamate synthase, partial [Treponema sp.]|nr:bifunctional ornithine acetyltransferase/N-acetylglutamate synthase [Treponema sp.]
MELVSVQGGVTASIGFKASALRCGIKESRKEVDLALIFSEKKCNAATVFTKNKIKAACISVTQEHISDGV